MTYINGIEPIREALCEYIENIIALSYSYMKKNKIPYDFSGNDNLSISLKLLIEISNRIKITNDKNEILKLKERVLELEKKVNNITNDGGIVNGRK